MSTSFVFHWSVLSSFVFLTSEPLWCWFDVPLPWCRTGPLSGSSSSPPSQWPRPSRPPHDQGTFPGTGLEIWWRLGGFELHASPWCWWPSEWPGPEWPGPEPEQGPDSVREWVERRTKQEDDLMQRTCSCPSIILWRSSNSLFSRLISSLYRVTSRQLEQLVVELRSEKNRMRGQRGRRDKRVKVRRGFSEYVTPFNTWIWVSPSIPCCTVEILVW